MAKKISRFKVDDIITYFGNKMLVISEPDIYGDCICLELEITDKEHAWENTGSLLRRPETHNKYKYLLDDENNTFGWYLIENDEYYNLSVVKNTRLARKMFPKAKESECGEWLNV